MSGLDLDELLLLLICMSFLWLILVGQARWGCLLGACLSALADACLLSGLLLVLTSMDCCLSCQAIIYMSFLSLVDFAAECWGMLIRNGLSSWKRRIGASLVCVSAPADSDACLKSGLGLSL